MKKIFLFLLFLFLGLNNTYADTLMGTIDLGGGQELRAIEDFDALNNSCDSIGLGLSTSDPVIALYNNDVLQNCFVSWNANTTNFHFFYLIELNGDYVLFQNTGERVIALYFSDIYTLTYGGQWEDFLYYSGAWPNAYYEIDGDNIKLSSNDRDRIFNTNNNLFSTSSFSTSGMTDITDDFNSNIGPTILAVNDYGTVINLEDGVQINGLDTNADFTATYDITEYNANNIGYVVDTGDLGSFTGGLNNINILNNENFTFQKLGKYDVGLFLTDPNDPTNTITKYYNADYTYNSGYVDPEVLSFDFKVSGYTTFENGFTLDNFVPNPTGGALYFEIIAPNSSGTGTINLTTDKYYNYGFDTQVKVTYPYHQTAGTYQVRTVYEYQNKKIYPFGENYDSYPITLAEVTSVYSLAEDLDGMYICDTDGSGITEIGEAIACPLTILKYYTLKVYDYIDNIKQFINKIGGAFTTEVKTFSFIPQTNASNIIVDGLNNVDTVEYKKTTIGKIDTFTKGFISFFVFVLGFVVFIGISRSRNG